MSEPSKLDGKSIVEKMINNELERKRKKEIIIEKAGDWKRIVNGVGSTRNGKEFLKVLVRHAGIFSVDEDYNGVNLVAGKGKSEFYRNYVRPYLDKEFRNEIE